MDPATEAERRIEACRRDGDEYLNLSGLGLRAVPDSLSGLTTLTTLTLSRNRLASLPDDLWRMDALTHLDVSSNDLLVLPEQVSGLRALRLLDVGRNLLTAVPDQLRQLTALTDLNLSRNRLAGLPDWLGELSRLHHLGVGDCGLTELPEWLAQHTQLIRLNVDDNRLTTLPDWLSGFSQLTWLDVDGNDLTELPDWLGEHRQLTRLYVSSNRLDGLPDALANLTALHDLGIANCGLRSLPSWISDLRQLRYFDAENNLLTELPDWLGEHRQLTQLYVSNNLLDGLPDALANLTALYDLGIANCGLDELPAWIAGLPRLTYLSVNGNRLTELPDWLSEHRQLNQLYISSNQLDGLPDTLANLTALQTLGIGGCRLRELPTWIGDLPHLTYLDAADNQLTGLPDWLGEQRHLAQLYVSGNLLDGLPDSLANLTALQSLGISGCRLHELPAWIAGLPRLTYLDADNNLLTELPDWLGEHRQLIHLYVSNNRLDGLPDALPNLTALQSLGIGGCGLHELPAWIADLPRLSYLSAIGNRLTELPDWLGERRHLTQLYVSGNQLDGLPDALANLTALQYLGIADCSLAELPTWIARIPRLIYLSVTGNRLTELPDWLGEHPHLTQLLVSNNRLDRLPDALANLTALRTLGIAECGLRELPAWIADLPRLTYLDVSDNQLTGLPDWLGERHQLTHLYVSGNQLDGLPDALANLTALQSLGIATCGLQELPAWIAGLRQLTFLNADDNRLTELPDWLGTETRLTDVHVADNELTALPDWTFRPPLRLLDASRNRIATIPDAFAHDRHPTFLLDDNELSPEIAAAYAVGTDEFWSFLTLLREDGTWIREAKLILAGEGAAGKSSLLAAMRDEPWVDGRSSTHGIEIKEVQASAPGTDLITLNGWDFGGQPDYRPTHQLFFTTPAVYLVVWDPRRGPEVSYVDFWIETIKNRAGREARIHVVATRAAAGRGAWIDEAGLRSRFGDIIVDFWHVDSRTREGIDALMQAIAITASGLPHLHRPVPRGWIDFRRAIRESDIAYLAYGDYERQAADYGLTPANARTLATTSNSLGHWIYYGSDPNLDHLVIFKADWLSTAISLVLDDATARSTHGLLPHRRLNLIWDDPERGPSQRYPSMLHPVFLYLMETFEISYRIAIDGPNDEPKSLVAQLVESERPDLRVPWDGYQNRQPMEERVYVCAIVDNDADRDREPIALPGLMYRLIVRWHRYSLGRHTHTESRHWQGGIIVDNSFHGRALVTTDRNRVTVRVRAFYPQFFANQLTDDIRDLVKSGWRGVDVRILIPCGPSCAVSEPGSGLFDLEDLYAARANDIERYLCKRCSKAQHIDDLLLGRPGQATDGNSRIAQAIADTLRPEFDEVVRRLTSQHEAVTLAIALSERTLDSVNLLSIDLQQAWGRIEKQYHDLMLALDDDAADGPRLFTLEVLKTSVRHPGITSQRIRITLWCEHSRLPVPQLSPPGTTTGVYDLDVPRAWVAAAAPWFKAITIVLRGFLPVAASIVGGMPDPTAWQQSVATNLQNAQSGLEALGDAADRASGLSEQVSRESPAGVDTSLTRTIRAYVARVDPDFAGLERVRTPQGYRWVHRRFAEQYRLSLPEMPSG